MAVGAAVEPAGALPGNGWATLTPMSFAEDDLARIRAAEEVEIETQAPDGPAHRTIIWIVVDDDEAFIRSYKAPTAAGSARPPPTPPSRSTSTAVASRRPRSPPTDPDSIDRVERRLLTAKYARRLGDLRSMLATPTSTLRLEPA